jgi:hypothetical protein
MKRNHRPGIAAAAVFVLIGAAGRTAPRPGAEKWDIQITVACDGQYSLEAGETRYDGQYGFTAHWVGLMERDDEDFLIIHKSVELERWQAAEKAARPGQIELLEAKDFSEKPELRVNYILRKGGFLEIALTVLGFEVPRQGTPDTFRLALPCSAEDTTAPAGVNYGAYVTEGSNRVFLDEAAIVRRTEVKKFGWTWKWRAWIQKMDQTVLNTNSHKAVVTVAVTPHQEEGSPRRADERGRKPSAAGRG